MFIEEFCKAGIFNFFQLLKSDYEIYLYDKVTSAFHMIPNNTSFIKYIKFVSAILMTWSTTINSNSHEPSFAFSGFKQTVKQQIAALGSSSKTAYKFLRNKVKVMQESSDALRKLQTVSPSAVCEVKVLSVKQQLKR